jgi:hypothetical protein
VVLGHETLLSSVSLELLGVGLGTIDQPDPFQCTASVFRMSSSAA